MMRILRITLLLSLGIVLLSGCTSDELQATIDSQKEEIQMLQREKQELSYLLQNERQKAATSHTSTSPAYKEEVDNETLTLLFKTFVTAQFEQDQEQLKTSTSASFYTILVDQAGAYDSEISFQSNVKEIDLYQIKKVDEDLVRFVGKITVETKVGDFPANKYTQLIECHAKKNSAGLFEIDDQVLMTIS